MIKPLDRIAPTLDKLLKAGIVFESDGDYCGIASDGIQVSFGSAIGEAIPGIESYLKANPTPDKW